MEHPILFLQYVFNLFGLGDFAHHYPWVVYSWLVMIFLVVVGRLATAGIKMVPTGAQNLFEPIIEGLENFMVDVMGEEGRPYFPLIGTLFIYIFVMNLLGLIPGMFSSTANLNTTLSMALVVFFMTHYIGIRRHGFKYVKHFMGPVWWLSPLMIPIEVISHLSRVLSLTFRLFGNIFAEELVLAILIMLAGQFLAPFPLIFLFMFNSFVQAFIFTMLTMMYLSGAIEEAH